MREHIRWGVRILVLGGMVAGMWLLLYGQKSGVNRRKPVHTEEHSLTVGSAEPIPDAGFDETGFRTLFSNRVSLRGIGMKHATTRRLWIGSGVLLIVLVALGLCPVLALVYGARAGRTSQVVGSRHTYPPPASSRGLYTTIVAYDLISGGRRPL